jgi:DNA polymerase-3 subunit epsilon
VHRMRLATALSPLRVPRWPWRGPAGVREAAPEGAHTQIHLFERWCYLGSARDEDEVGALLEGAPRHFDLDTYRVLAQMLRRRSRPPQVVDLSGFASQLRGSPEHPG